MSLLITGACLLLACLVGLWGGVMLRAHYDEIQSAKVNPAGTIIITFDAEDKEAYLFLDTKLSPAELSYHKEAVFKIETRH